MNEQKVIVAATANCHKLEEFREILSDWHIISAAEAGFTEDVEETGDTFAENSALKAAAVCKATGLPSLADDSGLCVNCLNGAPGLYSARYSGKGSAANRRLLLDNMAGKDDRSAYFICAITLAFPDGETLTAEGRTYGEILTEETGENGFGYDSLFFSDELGKSFGVATEEEKNSVSHRGKALRNLRKLL